MRLGTLGQGGWSIGLTLLAIAFAGCERTASVRGTIVDVRGDTLPGVAVTVRGMDHQDISNIHGQYELRVPPGEFELEFAKTGYTMVRMPVSADAGTPTEIDEVTLWPLPETQGVYLFENFRYWPLTRVEPKRYLRVNQGDGVYGMRKDPDRFTHDPETAIIAYRMRDFDVQIHRLEQVDAIEPQDQRAGYSWEIWAPAESVPVLAVPIDEVERLLLELRLQAPLQPGVYAVSWGALEGHTSTDPRVFTFKLLAPDEIPPEPEEAEEEVEEAPRPRQPIYTDDDDDFDIDGVD